MHWKIADTYSVCWKIGSCRALWFPAACAFQGIFEVKCFFSVTVCLQATLYHTPNAAIFRSEMQDDPKKYLTPQAFLVLPEKNLWFQCFPPQPIKMGQQWLLTCAVWRRITICRELKDSGQAVLQKLMMKINNSVSIVGLGFCTVPPLEWEENSISIFLFDPFSHYITKWVRILWKKKKTHPWSCDKLLHPT